MKETLKKYWGYENFRPMQEEIISSALGGNDTLAILPTGGGKSICFQVPAMMRDGVCIVVSPLIALMKDQVENLRNRGIPASVVHSGMTSREIDITLDNAIYGDVKFLYVSPERLRTNIFKVRVQKMSVSFIVVDEAHCISQWGYDFRPDYLEIAQLRKIVPDDVPILAMTATATPAVADDIMEKLNFRKPNILKSSFLRTNLSYVFRKVEDKTGRLLKVCGGIGGSGIVYVNRRKSAEDLAAVLRAHGITAEAYHAGLSQVTRNSVQERWKNDVTRIIVSTNAFGMGIDKAAVRFVCHYDMPASIENYYQEAGRAGRDGQPSFCVLLYNDTDIARLRQILKTSYPPLDYIKEIYQKVFTFVGYSYEEGAGACVKFNLEDFAKRFKLHATTAYYAIKYIETAGYWTLTETVEIPAKLQFIVGRDQLYRIQLGSPDMDTFVKLLLRMYTGLFSEYVSIDVEKIAIKGHYAPEVVKEHLKRLSRMDVVKYIPQINSPMLNIVNERLVEKNLRLPKEDYDRRVGLFRERLEAMIDVAQDSTECRSVKLVRYFGEEASARCGRCDVCLGSKGEGPSESQRAEYEKFVNLRR